MLFLFCFSTTSRFILSAVISLISNSAKKMNIFLQCEYFFYGLMNVGDFRNQLFDQIDPESADGALFQRKCQIRYCFQPA